MLPIVLSSILLAAPAAQMPAIGVIDLYGVRTVTVADLRTALGVEEGDPAPEEVSGLRRRLESVPGVVSADVSAVCCVDGRTVLWVGIEERGEPALAFDPAPAGTVRLPADVVQAGADFDAALMAAVQAGDANEDDSAGHALMHNPAARAIQERFIGFAARDLAVLRDVLHHGRRADERALAAQVIAYAADKAAVVPDLVRAMRDPDDEVRNNAMRALWVMAEYAAVTPDTGIQVPAAPFVDLLNSLRWTDRNKASLALFSLSASRDPAVLDALRTRAFDALVEMAQWKARAYALAPFFLLGRVAGLPEDAIKAAWDRDDRAAVVAAARRRHS
jgi:hypothetical protein